MGRDDQTGLPNQPIPCPLGARHTSDSCEKAHCAYVSIPLHHRISFSIPPRPLPTGYDNYLSTIWQKLLYLTLIIIFLKYFLILCTLCFSLLVDE